MQKRFCRCCLGKDGSAPAWAGREDRFMELDAVTSKVLAAIDAGGFQQEGAYNLRYNGQALCHGDSEHIKIKKKEGVSIYAIHLDAYLGFLSKLFFNSTATSVSFSAGFP